MLHTLVRFPLRAIPKRAVFPILSGPAMGMRWIVGASTHGCWLGTYEKRTMTEFARHVRSGMTIYDVGAHAGYYTLASAALVGTTGRVVAYEPMARTMRTLRRHVEINHLVNVLLFEAAATDRSGNALFGGDSNPAKAHLTNEGQDLVETVAIDAQMAMALIPAPDIIKIDVEGAAARVLTGARETIRINRPIIFLETHPAHQEHVRSLAILRDLQYTVVPIAPAHGSLLCLPK